ncbi:MAG: dephospho-CoA kinase [Lachnospiraceae bacterium]|nr:dephospho-CoA kinase [Lachnospiraceae bacterium]
MTVLGITGGIGAGKSRILDLLKECYGAEIIEADQVARQLEEPGQAGYEQLVTAFGAEILDGQGKLERAAFAARIFQDEAALMQVNAIIHPLTWQAIREQIAASRADLIVIESALFDQKSRELCQKLIYVDTSKENRISRLMADRHYTREKCLDIMKNQPGREEFLAVADFVIDNNKTIEAVRQQLEDMLQKIRTEG